jgi:hypothetical protein
MPDDETGGAIRLMKKHTGSRWEITVDGKPRTYDHKRELAIEAAEYLKLKNPAADVNVRDLEGTEQTIIIPTQQPRVRR